MARCPNETCTIYTLDGALDQGGPFGALRGPLCGRCIWGWCDPWNSSVFGWKLLNLHSHKLRLNNQICMGLYIFIFGSVGAALFGAFEDRRCQAASHPTQWNFDSVQALDATDQIFGWYNNIRHNYARYHYMYKTEMIWLIANFYFDGPILLFLSFFISFFLSFFLSFRLSLSRSRSAYTYT